MKFLKKLSVLLLSLVCVVLLIALFVRDDFSVKRSIELNVPSETVYEYVRFLKNQDEFGPWQKLDPKMQHSIEGEDGEVGAISSWNSKNEDVGVGEQEIIRLEDGKRVEFELRFKEPFESTASAYFSTEAKAEGKTLVSWSIYGESSWPWNIMYLFMDMDQELGPDLDKGLKNLKKILEAQETED